MSIYKYITVKDLIAKNAVTNLYMEKMGFVYADNESRIFKEIRDTNIDAYYFFIGSKRNSVSGDRYALDGYARRGNLIAHPVFDCQFQEYSRKFFRPLLVHRKVFV